MIGIGNNSYALPILNLLFWLDLFKLKNNSNKNIVIIFIRSSNILNTNYKLIQIFVCTN
jgi:hypothetical protein